MTPYCTLAFSRPDGATGPQHRTESGLAPRAGLPADATINLGEYLRDISAAVVAALSDDRDIRLQVAGGECVSPERALTIGVIVIELVTNAVKYAHPTGVPGDITITCGGEADGSIIVEVSDDGVGLPEGLDPMTTDSFGLQLVRSLATQLNARIEFAHDALGLSCVLQVPGEARA